MEPDRQPAAKTLPQEQADQDGIYWIKEPTAAVALEEWPSQYMRENRPLKGLRVPLRNKFSARQLSQCFKYLGGYRRRSTVPASAISFARENFADFRQCFATVSDKTIIDKIRAWPKDEDLRF